MIDGSPEEDSVGICYEPGGDPEEPGGEGGDEDRGEGGDEEPGGGAGLGSPPPCSKGALEHDSHFQVNIYLYML